MASSQQKPKFYYFDAKGKGEITRLVFVLAGVEFEDFRFQRDEWAELKPKIPLGTVPALEINGEIFGQSIAIASYVAKEYGLHGQTNLEELRINQMAQLLEEIWTPAIKVFFEQDAVKKAELQKELKTVTARRCQQCFEDLVKKYGKGYTVGDRLTLADILIYDLYTGALGESVDDLENYPLCKAIVEKLSENERIKAWNKKTQRNKPKLYYFDVDGRAEVTRLTFVLAGKEFEDIRFSKEQWPEYKPKMPHGVCPVLEINGEKFGESLAIAFYVAKENGLYGQTNLEQLSINQMALLIEEIRAPAVNIYYTKDPEAKANLEKQLRSETAPKYQKFLEEIIEKKGKNGFAVGNWFTLADILVYDLYTGYLKIYVDDVENYPLSKGVIQKLSENDKIKSWKAKAKA